MNLFQRVWTAVIIFAFGGLTTAEDLTSPALYLTDQNSTFQDTFDATLASYRYDDSGCEFEQCASGPCDYDDDCECATGSVLAGDLCDRNCCRKYFVGVDYLYVRANFSEMLTYIEKPQTDDQETFHQQHFQADSSYRLYGGIRDACSGLEWNLNFTRFSSHAPGFPQQSDDDIIIPLYPSFNADPTNPHTVTVSAVARVNSYDIGCAKTIPYYRCDCGNSCDSDSCCCPLWDFTWEAGVRYTDVAWQQNIPVVDRDGKVTSRARNSMKFQGTGLRFGLGGRRYFGCQGCFSVFLNGDISLLVGDVEVSSIRHNPQGSPIPSYRQSLTARNVIPVTEIEAGITGQITSWLSLSSGYLFSAWHDLGMRQDFSTTATQSELGIVAFDDANILAFDGFFARLEAEF
jgi:hypothetical protein